MATNSDPVSELPARFAAPWSDDRPVWQQVAERLAAWIRERCPTGFRLPAERELAAVARVNRLTLRKATARLLQDGVLERTAHTTRVKSTTAPAVEAPEEPLVHPLLACGGAQRRPLLVACFESLPWQAACWREAQPILAAAAGCPVEFRPVPVSVAAAPAYAEFLAAERIDLAFLTSLMFDDLIQVGALAPLPDPALASAPGLAAAVHSMPERARRHFVPVHLAWRCTLVAERLVADMPPAARLDPVAFAAWLAAQADRLPPEAVLLDDPGYLALLAGEPVGDPGEAWFHALGALGGAIGSALHRCTWYVDEPARGRSFAAGRAVAFLGNGFYGPGRFAATPGLRWRALPVAPLSGCCWQQGATGVAMTAACRAPDAAAAALAAFTSPAVQDLVARHRLNLPVRESSWEAYAASMGMAGAAELAAGAAGLRINFAVSGWSRFLEHSASGILRRGVASARSCEEAFRSAAAVAGISGNPTAA